MIMCIMNDLILGLHELNSLKCKNTQFNITVQMKD